MSDFPAPGTEMAYTGPTELPGEWVAPKRWKQPFTFRFVSVHGTLACDTRFNGRKRLPADHPANNPDYWEVA